MPLCTLGLNPLLLKTQIHWVLGFTSWPKMCEILDINMNPLNMWVVLQPHMQIISSLFCGGFWIVIPIFSLPSFLFSSFFIITPRQTHTSLHFYLSLPYSFFSFFSLLRCFSYPPKKKSFFFLRKSISRVKGIWIQWFFFPTRREGVMIL